MNFSYRIFERKWMTALGGFAVCLAMARELRAEPFFPSDIQTHLNLSYAPPCTFCHATTQGGGPVVTKFGSSMLAAGLGVTNDSLNAALDTLAANKTDSDGDGTPDIQQIEEGRDPSTGTAPSLERYGCGARIATTPVRFVSVLLCAAAVVGIAVGRRRAQFARGGSPNERTNNS